SDSTMDKFSLLHDDRDFDVKFDSENFIEKMIAKYQKISELEDNPILYVVNLLSNENRLPDYLDREGNSVKNIENSHIRILPSVLSRQNANETNYEFAKLINFLN
ncbi:MAG: hypothetical protein ACR2MS_09095, partial [Weeksellaceae bacterium]